VTALVAQALKRLEAELATRGKEELFKGLQPFLREGVALPTQENVAANLGMPIDTLRAVIFRECVHVIEIYYARNFGRAMQAMFQTDLQKSKEYTLADFRKRSLWERTIEWLMLPFRSQM